MINYIINIGIILAIYAVIINKIDSGRCFRYEFIIKTLAIMGMEAIIAILILLNIIPLIAFLSPMIIMVLIFFSLKFNIQRFYDLNMSGWYILLKLIPIFSIFVTFYLYFKKGSPGINDYDKAINYKKLFKGKYCIDIYKNALIIKDETYQYDTYLNKHTIKISKYGQGDIFSEYLLKNYPVKENGIYKTIEMRTDELTKIINTLGLIVIDNSVYLKIKGFEVFIRKENFRFTIILSKEKNEVSKELFDTFDFPGSFFEDEEYIYYNKISKDKLLAWAKTVA